MYRYKVAPDPKNDAHDSDDADDWDVKVLLEEPRSE
jgi:hypothetical protein